MKKLLAMALLVCVCLSIVACGIAKDPADLKKNLEDKDYEVLFSDKELEVKGFLTMLGLPTDGAAAVVNAGKEEDDEEKVIIVIYYEDAKAAGEAYEKLQDAVDELLEDIDDDAKDDYKTGKSGNAIYFGHKDAIKDAK